MYHISNRPSLQAYFMAKRVSEAEFYFPSKYLKVQIINYICLNSNSNNIWKNGKEMKTKNGQVNVTFYYIEV